MSMLKKLFLNHIAPTSESPLLFEVAKAEGVYLYDQTGKRYLDLNSGISVSSVGHCHPKIISAIKDQSEKYLHTMVYGEHIQSPQVLYAEKLIQMMGPEYEMAYFLMAGTEATELSLKLARKYTGKSKVISAKNAYHGSTLGSESLRSDFEYKKHFMPLIPGITHFDFNSFGDILKIDSSFAAVICEAVQAEAGVIPPAKDFLNSLQSQCKKQNCLFILDEIQTGFGRTGELFGFMKYGVKPDIILLGKAMAGGMPLSAVVSRREIFQSIIKNPSLGHITTFGGHPLSCAAALASLDILQNEIDLTQIEVKGQQFEDLLTHPLIFEIRRSGLMLGVELIQASILGPVIDKCREFGVFIDWFLFNERSFRIAPPLTINRLEIVESCQIILKALDFVQHHTN